jgi:hypothetical protein
MRDGKQLRASLTALAILMVPGCGADSPSTPTPSYSQTTTIVDSTGFGGAATTCNEFNNAKAGPVSAFVTPPSIHLVLRTGPCNAPGQIVAEKDTELVNVNAPAGSNNVRLSNPNPSGPETPYMLRLTYWR